MTHSRSIAVAQTCPVTSNVQANLDENIRLARLAAKEGAQVIVFPELCLTGYELGRGSERHQQGERQGPRHSWESHCIPFSRFLEGGWSWAFVPPRPLLVAEESRNSRLHQC